MNEERHSNTAHRLFYMGIRIGRMGRNYDSLKGEAMYERLREIITKKGITTNKLARITNIASQDLYNAYKGRKRIYPNWKKRIAEALEMPEEIIFGEREKKMIECICDLCKKRINPSDIKMSFYVTVDGKKTDIVDMHSSCYYKFMAYAKKELIDSRDE